jgi:hypothetical protein
MALSKADILKAAAPLPPVPLVGPELGGAVFVARMSARGADEYARDVKAAADGEVRGTILAHALVGEDGRRLFATADARALGDLPKAVADAVADAFSEANGLDAKKPSPTTSGSSSASPSPSGSGT